MNLPLKDQVKITKQSGEREGGIALNTDSATLCQRMSNNLRQNIFIYKYKISITSATAPKWSNEQ